ncbi:hypothetical protein G6F36_013485 [Rhizopus arrhizus]|nr:hypothetical protein G6F36_013485 [Rhizopus arrhizus]
MCFHFYYEDEQGKIVDEQGNDAMGWKDDVTQFHFTTLTRIRQYRKIQGGEEEIANTVKLQRKVYNKYSNELKPLFVYMNRIKLFNDANSGRLANGIAKRTAQKWAKRLKEDKDWNILEKQTWLIDQSLS